jgi:hypothetical protein
MAWTTPSTWTTGQVVTAADLNAQIRDNMTFVHATHGGRLHEAAALSQTNSGSFQLVTWDTVTFDTEGAGVVADTTNRRLNIPTGYSGYWFVTAHVEWTGNATGRRELKLVKNETYTTRAPNGVGTAVSNDATNPAAATVLGQDVHYTGSFTAGDWVTLEAYQNSGGNLAFTTNSAVLWLMGWFLGI